MITVDPLPDISPVQSALKDMLGPGVAIAVDAPRVMNDQLYAEEREYIARAVPIRQAEFGTARVCARRALAELDIAPVQLVPHADRSPCWPRGIAGSISHTAGCCAVAVTNDTSMAGLGLDLEEDIPLPRGLVSMICTPAERAWLDTHEIEQREALAKLIFSAKEAFYKCQYASTRTLIDFQEVELGIDIPSETFAIARLFREGAVWRRVQRAQGKFRRVSSLLVTTAVLPAG